jgi:hypothetical protein
MGESDVIDERIREIAIEEIEGAVARFWARVGKRPDVDEQFAAGVADWLANWVHSYLVPDEPIDPELERRWLEQVDRAKRDLELQAEDEPGDETERG